MKNEINYFDVSQLKKIGKYSDFGWDDRNYFCPYCKIALDDIQGTWNDKTIVKAYNETIIGYESLYAFTVKKCRICGWWEVWQVNADTMDDYYSRLVRHNSILKKTEINSQQIPINELGKYLSKNSDKIYKIHFKKMEELVGAVFKEHYNCEVIHCGQSYDRGIDLFMIKGDDTIPIQVKRRTNPNSKESVSVVREMLGVMFRDSRKSAILVSTAKDFSREAKKDVNQVLKLGLVETFELFNYDKFIGILKNVYKDYCNDFIQFIPKLLGGQGEKI